MFSVAQMVDSAPAPKYIPKIPGKGADDDLAPIHKIRITLTSRNVKNLEKGAHSGSGTSPDGHSQNSINGGPCSLGVSCSSFVDGWLRRGVEVFWLSASGHCLQSSY